MKKYLLVMIVLLLAFSSVVFATGDKEAATTAYKQAVPVLDSYATSGLIHKNKAARHKSRLNAHIKAMA